MIPVCLGLGANLGNCIKTLQDVSHVLSCYSDEFNTIQLVKASSVYTSPPYQGGDQDIYYNQVLIVTTTLSAWDLLKNCLQIEEQFGRIRGNQKHWEARTIDIDILYYGSQIIKGESLQIPHYDLTNRAFFLKPLCEISPQWQDPHLKCSVSQMWQALLKTLPQNQIPQKLNNSDMRL